MVVLVDVVVIVLVVVLLPFVVVVVVVSVAVVVVAAFHILWEVLFQRFFSRFGQQFFSLLFSLYLLTYTLHILLDLPLEADEVEELEVQLQHECLIQIIFNFSNWSLKLCTAVFQQTSVFVLSMANHFCNCEPRPHSLVRPTF